MSLLRASCSAFIGICLLSAASAQDTRDVHEPKIPPTCISLPARLTAQSENIKADDETRLDTARIQDAIDNCAPGKAVALRVDGEKNAFLSAPLELRRGITLVVDSGVTLYGSRDPKVYDKGDGTCGTVTEENDRGCKPLIHIAGATDAAVMGEGIIDGRGGSKLLGQNVSWWDLAQDAKVRKQYQNCPRIIVADRADNFILYRITLKNSPNFHVMVMRTNGFTAWNVKIFSPKAARNTDGIDPSSSTNVSILHSFIHAGDDNVAIKAGVNGPSSRITIAHNHFYAGHGMSIGSETQGNIEAVLVRDLTIEGADNGLRVKSNSTRGGFVRGVVYEDVCIRKTKNPIIIDPYYSTERGTLVPNFDGITLKNIRVLTPGEVTILGTDDYHRTRVTFDGVNVDGVDAKVVRAVHARISVGPAGLNFTPAGEDVVVRGKTGSANAPECEESRFVPFPDTPTKSAASIKKDNLTVAADGSGDFATLQQAVDSLPEAGGTIHIKPGVYREAVEITNPHVRILGDPQNPSSVVIVYDKSAGTSGGTFNSQTMLVTGDDFLADGITIQNDFSKKNPDVTSGAQAVALAVRGNRALFRHVRLLGAQDTLFAAAKSCEADTGPCVPARQYFSDCYIEGHIDFIFGDSKAYFRNCEIHVLASSSAYLTAQSKRYPEQESGYVFDSCKVTSADGASRVFLGRPWRRYSTVVFLDTDLPSNIAPEGWSEWHAGETNALTTATYAEYNSKGPGADPAHRERYSRQLSRSEAEKFRSAQFLRGPDGWNPER